MRIRLKPWHVVLAAVGVLVVLVGLYMRSLESAMERRLKALRAAGYPTTFAELTEYTKLPEGVENAAELYQRAFAAFVPPAEDANVPILLKEVGLPRRGEPMPEAMARDIQKVLEANRECLALLRRAADIEHCRYEWDYADVLDPRIRQDHRHDAISCGLLLRLTIISHAYKDDSDAAVETIRIALALAESMHREPGGFGHALRISHRASALIGLERALSETTFTREQLLELDRMLAASAASLDLKETMVTARCIAIEQHRHWEYSRGWSPLDAIRWGDLQGLLPGRRARRFSDVLDRAAACVAAADLPDTQRFSRFRESGRTLGSDLMQRAAELDLRVRSQFDLARTALTIERYRLATGDAPDELRQLVPQYMDAVPIDPYDGEPIRYRRTEPGYVLYNILEDGQDNGGVGRHEAERGEPYDWPFIVMR